MAATTFHSVIIVFWKETAFPRWRAIIIIIIIVVIQYYFDSRILAVLDIPGRDHM